MVLQCLHVLLHVHGCPEHSPVRRTVDFPLNDAVERAFNSAGIIPVTKKQTVRANGSRLTDCIIRHELCHVWQSHARRTLLSSMSSTEYGCLSLSLSKYNSFRMVVCPESLTSQLIELKAVGYSYHSVIQLCNSWTNSEQRSSLVSRHATARCSRVTVSANCNNESNRQSLVININNTLLLLST